MRVQISEEFESQECIACGISFALTSTVVRHLRETRRSFSCLNGHPQNYTATIETEKKIAQLERRVMELETELGNSRVNGAQLTRVNASLRGVIAKLQRQAKRKPPASEPPLDFGRIKATKK